MWEYWDYAYGRKRMRRVVVYGKTCSIGGQIWTVINTIDECDAVTKGWITKRRSVNFRWALGVSVIKGGFILNGRK